jgi:hypothetical protein
MCISLVSLAWFLLTTTTLAHASTPPLASIKAVGPNMVITTPNGEGTVFVDGVLDLKMMYELLLTAIRSDETTKASQMCHSFIRYAVWCLV